MRRPLLLDTFCKAGGAAMGYNRAGFDVLGVDIEPQPHYPFDFIQADALAFLRGVAQDNGAGFAAVHASPPCQAFTTARVIHGRDHPDLLTPTRKLLDQIGLPYIIENVPGAPMREDLVLCGSMFGLRAEHGALRRHRLFEFSQLEVSQPECRHNGLPTISVFGHGGHVYHGVAEWREVMGIDWMTRDELAQAIPPAYTEFIGRQLIEVL